MIEAVRGTKDIFDKDIAKMDLVIRKAEEILKRYGFKHIITPTFEETALFKRGIGEGTDIVSKEMYSFVDRGDREITLRPEGTASVVRAYMEHKLYGKENFTRFFYYGPMFRYEKPQKGRYREFYQIGAEAIGLDTPELDAEIIAMGYHLLTELKIEDIELQINSVGCPVCRKEYREKLKEFLQPKLDKLCHDCKDRYDKNPLRILDCKIDNCKNETQEAPKMIDYLCDNCTPHFERVKKHLELLNVPYVVNTRLVRGLDYYTNTAFEIVTNKLGSQGTVLAGGRYNNLIEEIGGKSIPAVGFAAGVERVAMLIPDDDITDRLDVFVVNVGDENRGYLYKIVDMLRKAGISTQYEYEVKNVKNQMKNAAKQNAKYAIIVGDDERNENVAVIKDMDNGTQEKLTLEDIIKKLK